MCRERARMQHCVSRNKVRAQLQEQRIIALLDVQLVLVGVHESACA